MISSILNLIGKHNRVATVVIVLLLVSITYVYRLNTNSSLADNLYAGAIEISITVLLIQSTLSLERKHRLRQVSANGATGIKFMSALFTLQILSEMGLKIENGIDVVQQATNKQLRDLQEQFFDSQEYHDFLKGVTEISASTTESFVNLTKLLQDWSGSIDNSLQDIKPYPQPEIVAICNEMRAKASAFGLLIDEYYFKLQFEIEKMHKRGSKRNREVKEVYSELWKSSVLGSHDSSHGLSNMIREILDSNLVVHKAAENNGLYIDL